MKRIIFILIVLVSTVNSVFAQRLNKYGQKMVSEIVVEEYYSADNVNKLSSISYIKYKYNDNNELQECSYEKYSKRINELIEKYTFTKNGNRIYRKGFERDETSEDTQINVYCNDSNLISKIEIIMKGIDGSYAKDVTIYYYKDVLGDGVLRCYRDINFEMYKSKNDKEYRTYATHDHDNMSDIKKLSFKGDDKWFIIDNININLTFLPNYSRGYMATEWQKSKMRTSLFKKDKYCKIVYDNKDNLIELYEYRIGSKSIERHIKIKYVEE